MLGQSGREPWDQSYGLLTRFYGVPAAQGKAVTYSGDRSVRVGIIVGSDREGMAIWLHLEGDAEPTGPYHPTWEIDYGDGIDHGARVDARIESFNAAINRGAR